MKRHPAAPAANAAGTATCANDGRPTPPGAASRRAGALVFRALADVSRAEIFALVASRPEPICVCDITGRFDLSQPTVSHHLKVLREAGLVTVSRRGTWAYYAVDATGVRAARAAVDAVLAAAPAVRR